MASACEVIWPKVYLYGDSITQRGFRYDGCWAANLANDLIRKCDVIDRGFGGYNTRWNKILLPRLIPAHEGPNIHLVVVFLGTNDCQLPGGHSYVPLEEYRTNLISIIDYLMAIGVKRDHIMLVDPPVCNTQQAEQYAEEHRGEEGIPDGAGHTLENTKKYVDACLDVAQKWRVGSISLFDNMYACANWRDMLWPDGIHFSHLGASFMYKLLWPWVEERCRNLPMILPDHNDIDADDPEKSLTQGGAEH